MENLGEIYCLTSPSGKKYIGQCCKYLSSGKTILEIPKQKIIVDY